MADHEFMKIHKKYFSSELRTKYNLNSKIGDDDYVYCHIKKVCMVLSRLHALLTTISFNILTSMATFQIQFAKIFGHIRLEKQNSVFVLTTLASSTLMKTIRTTCVLPEEKSTKSQ